MVVVGWDSRLPCSMIVLGVILDEVVLVPREATASRRILTVAALAAVLRKMRSEILLEIIAF